MIDTHIIPKTVNDIHFFVSLREIRESIARKPKIVEIQKCSKNLTIKMSKSLQEQDLRQKWNKDTSDVEKLNDEIDKLEDVLDEIAKLEDTLNEANEKSDIKVSLKNYVLFRLMSFFEFKILVSLKNAMDGGNNYQVTYGTEILQDGKGLVYNLDKMVILVLSDFMYKENRKFELNSDSSFMDFFDKIIEIKSEDLKNHYTNDIRCFNSNQIVQKLSIQITKLITIIKNLECKQQILKSKNL